MRKPSMRALIEILKCQNKHAPKMSWEGLEDHVKQVYEFLLSIEGENVVVGRNVQLRGKTGNSYKLDVFYEFEKAGFRHRVAFECKNTKRPVERAEVAVFKCAVDEFPGMTAVMISSGGYQSGARKFADDHSILLLELEDLPTISQLLGMRLEIATMPDEKVVGAPFWSIYEVETNAPYGMLQDGRLLSVLFFSKAQALQYLRDNRLEKEWVVRGMSQTHLRTFILTVDALDGRFLIVFGRTEDDGGWGGTLIEREKLISEFYVDPIPIPAERNVMPHLRGIKPS
ncbi:restriction endonuclease [Massilia eburnea]|uniref:restriction endonuclease n=1 Tax=Massilia eburnea TaxID=1776165 RepID=UPI003D6B2F4E